jgi:ribosomal-protein-alanine N-acetyltransferase
LTYSIRRMEKDDLGQVTEIDREAFPTQWPPANYRQELNNRLAHYLVVYDDTKTTEIPAEAPRNGLATLTAWLLPWSKRKSAPSDTPATLTQQFIIGFSGIWVMADESHITNIAVRREYQGRGIGDLLLIATIDLAMQLKATIMTLEVRTSNTVAQKLYGKYGFVKTGVRHGYYLDNREDAVIMSTESLTSEPFQQRLVQLRKTLEKKLV